MNKEQRITALLDKYTQNLCSDEEIEELFIDIGSGMHDSVLDNHVMQQLGTSDMEGADLESYRSAIIVHKILSANGENTTILRRISKRIQIIRYAVAAAVLILVAGAIWLFSSRENNLLTKESFGQIQKIGNDSKVINTTGKAMLVRLQDGSRITLQPDAMLYCQNNFNVDNRDVYLQGEAFFDIARDARKPFVVYHENLVTRVLGTSFYIRHNKQLKEVEVEVSTGKVEVYENIKDSGTHKRNNGVIITPNQKVVYAEDKRLFSTVLVDDPLPVATLLYQEAPVAPSSYKFEATSMSAIIAELEKDYEIEIQMENEDLKNCLFSGDISDQRLYAKLDILCKAIGITYELKGTRILIKGKGCR